MPDAVIVEAVRTPIGKRNGSLAGVHPVDLSAQVLSALAGRTGVDPALIDDVVWGCANQVGDQASQLGRYAALAAGWPETVPGVTITGHAGPVSPRSTSRPGWSCPASTTSSSPGAWSP